MRQRFKRARRSSVTRAIPKGLAFIMALLASYPAVSHAQGGTSERAERLLLEAYVNSVDTGRIVRVEQRGGEFFVEAEQLRSLSIRVPGKQKLKLGTVPGLAFEYDGANQRLLLTAAPDLLPESHLSAPGRSIAAASGGSGMILNYDLAAMNDLKGSGRPTLSTWAELRGFSPKGVASNTGTFRSQGSKYTRLDSSWEYLSAADMRGYKVGDLISGSLPWTRAVRMGGFQIRRNFGTRPDLITFPTPTFDGKAVVASTVDVLINDAKVFSGETNAGPFVINNVPALVGANTASVVVKDYLGRNVVTTVPIYVDNRLLKEGLSDYSLEAGWLRSGYGTKSFEYGLGAAASGSYSYGFSRSLTLQAHAEAGSKLFNAGTGAVFLLPVAGVLTGNLAVSSFAGTLGKKYGASYQYSSRQISLNAQGSLADRNYADIGSVSGTPNQRSLYSVSGSIPVTSTGSVSATWISAVSWQGNRSGSAVATLSYRILPGVNIVGSVRKSLYGEGGVSAYLGISFNLGKATNVTISGGRQDGGASAGVSVSGRPDYTNSFGYSVQTTHEAQSYRNFGRLDYLGQALSAYGALDQGRGSEVVSGGVSGSVAYMAGQAFATRTINDGFAVVSTDGVAGVPVMGENRYVAKTNADGYALVPDLLSYQNNQISIDTSMLKANQSIEVDAKYAVPTYRSGVLVEFPVKRFRGGLLELVGEDGTQLPVGTPVAIGAGGGVATVGFDGKVFLEQVVKGASLRAKVGGRECLVTLPDAIEHKGVGRIGRFVCRPVES
ncbi:fimbria/pilus outer membrane usher protein [Cupriavidus sp. UME77]|uniref:fimbria/pilus outer membrane usher protein n=2 Tax=Pseudomonadota TaxID=1224 RepID=UPI001602D79A|nr:fimbria/pilus outer membrane usher protein [Cupriavidus sp. UME77]MBB1634964.1 hypothetical protein [Cupriavidus sp. UME77]